MFDIDKETPITLAEAAKLYPNRRGGRGVDPATVWRHTTKGVREVVLASALFGGTRMTSREAVWRFFAAVTAAANRERIEAKSDADADDQAERIEAKSDADADDEAERIEAKSDADADDEAERFLKSQGV